MRTDDVSAGYKQSEVGVIPEDWEVKRIEEIASVTSGKRLPLGSSLIKTPTPYPYIRVTDMGSGTVSLPDILFVPESVFPTIRQYRIFRDDIFISVAGTIGIVGRIPVELDGANLTENANRITEITCSRDFLLYALNSTFIQKIIDSIRTVGAQPKLALGRIRQFTIPIPQEKREQQAIAEALSDVDSLLESLDALIAKKRAIKQAAMQQLLTGETRLPGFNETWTEKTLGNHVKFLRNGTYSRSQLTNDDQVSYLHYGDIHSCSNPHLGPEIREIPTLPNQLAKTLDPLKVGDLILVDASEDIEGIGKSVEISVQQNHQIVSGLHTIAARFDKSVLADGFKAYLQFCPPFRKHLRRLAAGTKVYATNRGHVASTVMKLPAPEEQRAIAAVLSDMDVEITALQQRREKTHAIKQAMMQQLLTGRIRLV